MNNQYKQMLEGIVRRRSVVLRVAIAILLCLGAGCVSSGDPHKREKRALAGGATSTALGVATGVGGPILAARAALGAASRVVTGDTVDRIKDDE